MTHMCSMCSITQTDAQATIVRSAIVACKCESSQLAFWLATVATHFRVSNWSSIWCAFVQCIPANRSYWTRVGHQIISDGTTVSTQTSQFRIMVELSGTITSLCWTWASSRYLKYRTMAAPLRLSTEPQQPTLVVWITVDLPHSTVSIYNWPSPHGVQCQWVEIIPMTLISQVHQNTKNVSITHTSCMLQRSLLSEHLYVCREFQWEHLRLFQDPADTLNNILNI